MYIIINERESERARERERVRELERERERERERKKEREREGERERERPNTKSKIRQKNLPRQFSRLLTPAPSLSVFHGNLPQEICGASSLMFIMGEREKERERKRERERNGESTLQDHIITMRCELHYIRVYPTIFSCVDPGHSSLGFSRESPAEDMGNLFPPWGINELEFSRQNHKFSSSYP